MCNLPRGELLPCYPCPQSWYVPNFPLFPKYGIVESANFWSSTQFWGNNNWLSTEKVLATNETEEEAVSV